MISFLKKKTGIFDFSILWSFSDGKYDVKKKTYLKWKTWNTVAYSWILYKTFQVFVEIRIHKLTGACFAAVKINLDNLSIRN